MQKLKRLISSSFRYVILMVFLIAVNFTLDITLTVWSGSAMKDLIGSRMLDVTNTAADMIDGDILRDLTPADEGTPEYKSVMEVLTYFQKNIELKYIYCIRDKGNKNFVFGLDPTIEDPGEFGSPIIYTDALYQASLGTPAFDSESYEDAWGTFYSAYSPVFASDGTVAGIIAVDFSKDWYDAQMSGQAHMVLLVNTLSLIVCGIMVFFMARSEKRRRNMADQLGATADIYLLMYEANLKTDTFKEVYNNNSAAKTRIKNFSASARFVSRDITERYTAPSSKEGMLEFVDLSTLNERLKDTNTVTYEFLSTADRWLRGRFIASEREPDGTVVRVMYLVEDIDAEKRKRDMTLEAAKLMNNQISTVANIYFSMHDINLADDTLCEIKTHVTQLSSFFSTAIPNAQQTLINEIQKSVHIASRESMLKFIDFSTLEERFDDTNTITEEFLNYQNVWSRARIIISQCTDDGAIEHVLFLIENIDEEKRKRDAISEQALNLNYQVSSLSNIYIILYDVDILDDTFSIIKSENMIINSLVGEKRSDAQDTMYKVMNAITDESSLEETLKFVDMSTLEKRLNKTNSVTFEILTTTKKWVRIRFLVSRRTNYGKLSHVLWLAEDIDAEKTIRDKLIDMSQRAIAASEAKSSFLSNMSHEIRTPINAVLGMNEMILRECNDQNILAYSNSIMNAGTTLLGLINDILDFSKIESGKMEIIPVDYDLASVLNDLVNMVQTRADNKGLSLDLEFDQNLPQYLHGDEIRIKQVITNILTNAVKYTKKGTVTFGITFSTIEDEPDYIMMNVYVKDTGIGIKKEDIEKLFSEFERIDEEKNRSIEGTGLGMNITQSLLSMMNSSLNVESVYELGSKFSFSLKQKVIKWEPIGDYVTSYRSSLNSRKRYKEKFTAPQARVLIIDDTPMNLMVFKSLLKQTKIQIDMANSGDEGISAALENKYDIIFLDHMMPKKDGIQTLKEMRSEKNNPNLDTTTICLTANAVSGAREQYIEAGFDDYLTKPIDPIKLEEMLMQYLPGDKLVYSSDEGAKCPEPTPDCNDVIPSFVYDISEINVETGIRNCGDAESYAETLCTYAEMLNSYISEIQAFYDSDNIQDTTIKIHALKSTSKIIGASDLGELAQELENAGKDGDTQKLADNINGFLDRCRKLSDQLSPLREQPDEDTDIGLPMISDDDFSEACKLIKEFSMACDSIGVSSILSDLKRYSMNDEQKNKVRLVKDAADNFDYDIINEILSN